MKLQLHMARIRKRQRRAKRKLMSFLKHYRLIQRSAILMPSQEWLEKNIKITK